MSPKSKEQPGEIRIVKKKSRHGGGHHGGAWKVAYADFVTAMMAFFLVMWITGMNDQVKQSVAGYFNDPKGFMEAVKAGNVPFEIPGNKQEKASPVLKHPPNKEDERFRLNEAKKTIEQMVERTPQFKKLKKHIEIKITKEGLKINLLEDKQSLFFDAASPTVRPEASSLLRNVAMELKKLPNRIIIEGHTDSKPLSRSDGYTNWDLSTERANSARRIMSAAGMSDGQIAQVRGYAATQPRDVKNPENPSNRRVTIIVVFREWENRESVTMDDLKTMTP